MFTPIGGIVQNMSNGACTPFAREGNVYTLSMWLDFKPEFSAAPSQRWSWSMRARARGRARSEDLDGDDLEDMIRENVREVLSSVDLRVNTPKRGN